MSFRSALKEPLLDREEERAALAAWQERRDRQALEVLIRSHARQAWAEARRWTDNPSHVEDLVAEGMIGLIQAADAFDLTTDVRFSTFAAWSVRNRIMAALGTVTAVIDVPARAYVDARSGRLGRNGRAEALAAISGVISIHGDGDEEGDRPASIAWDGLSPEDAVATSTSRKMAHQLLEEALETLEPREREVIRRRLERDAGLTDERTPPRARDLEIERRAMRRLRQSLQQRGFSFEML